jgi:alkanesulfonate monooxygenase SsuD/methylene tetrahydromethanopterin reductase-like flavin-dependent oxidoreductase (luciferase family)
MTRLAGEVGDGGFLMTGIHPNNIEEAKSLVAEGATLSGRDPSKIPLTFVSAIHMENDMEKAWQWSRPLCYNWIRDKQRAKWLLKAGVKLPKVEREEDLTIDHLRELCEVIGLFGTPEYCVDKIKSLETNYGVTSLFLQPTTTYDMPEETIGFLASSLQNITNSS